MSARDEARKARWEAERLELEGACTYAYDGTRERLCEAPLAVILARVLCEGGTSDVIHGLLRSLEEQLGELSGALIDDDDNHPLHPRAFRAFMTARGALALYERRGLMMSTAPRVQHEDDDIAAAAEE